MKVRYKKGGELLVYDPDWLVTMVHEPPPVLVGPFDGCKGCPYPGHGFICWGGERCLRTDVREIMLRPKFADPAG